MGQGQSRLEYQKAVGQLLAHPSLSPNDISFWCKFWTLPSSADEVFEGISPADIRSIKQQNPGNLAILLHKAVGQLSAWIQRTSTVPDSKASHEFVSALNCVRLITRILPFLFEDQSDEFVENVFWNNKLPIPVTPSPIRSSSTISQPGSPYIGNFQTSPALPRHQLPPSTTPAVSAPPSPGQSHAPRASTPPPPPSAPVAPAPSHPSESPLSFSVGPDPTQVPLPNSPLPFATSASIPSPSPYEEAQQPPSRDIQPVPFANLSEVDVQEQRSDVVLSQDNVTQEVPQAEAEVPPVPANPESGEEANQEKDGELEENGEGEKVDEVQKENGNEELKQEEQGEDVEPTAHEVTSAQEERAENVQEGALETEVTTTPIERPPSPSPASIPLPMSPLPTPALASVPQPAPEPTPEPTAAPAPSPAPAPAPAPAPVPTAPTPATTPNYTDPAFSINSPRPSTNPFEEGLPATTTTTTTTTPSVPLSSTSPPASEQPLQQSQTLPPTPPPPLVLEWHVITLGGGDQPLAARLLDTLLQLLFLPHFTVSASPPTIQQIQSYQQSEDGTLAHEQLPFYYFWAIGVGSETVIPTPTHTVGGTTIWANRMETLKCLLACFSQTLYITPDLARTHRNKWLEHVVCKHGYFSKALLCSLVNVVATYDPVGWGVPYNHIMFRDDHEVVASVALQVLNVLLQYNQHHFHAQVLQLQQRQLFLQQQQLQQQQQSYQQQQQLQQQIPPGSPSSLHLLPQSSQQLIPQPNGHPQDPQGPQASPRQQLADSSEHSPQHLHAQQLLAHSLQLQRAQHQLLQSQQPQQSEQHQNYLLATLADMKRNKDFQIIIDAFTRLMANPIVATAARLPYSVKQLEWHHHILMLFWHMIEDNKKFLGYLITSDKCPQLLVPMLVFMYDNRKDPSSLGVIQLCTFILLLLSGERDFAVTLNKPIIGARLPTDLPRPSVPYTHFDLIAIVAHRLLTDGGPGTASAAPHLAPVRECLLTALANASPFVKQIGMYAAMSLVKLFERLSDPQVLFSSENICRLVHLLLETFNNVIQYQFEGNPCLIYSILRAQNDFSKLAHLKIVHPPPSLPTAAFQTPEQLQLIQQAQQQVLEQQQIQQPQTPQQAQQPLPPPQYLPPQFVPTNEWLEAWKRTLPLDIILRMITMVSPKIQSVCTGSAAEEQPILHKLQNTTLVGLLPAPHPILIRKYQSNDATQTWLLSYLWGSIFLQQSHPPLFFGTRVKLFVLHTTNP
jgi:hypothetical protein